MSAALVQISQERHKLHLRNMKTYSKWIHDDDRRVLIHKRSRYEVDLRAIGKSSASNVSSRFITIRGEIRRHSMN